MKSILKLLKPYTIPIFLGLLLAAGNVLATLAMPVFFGKMIDGIIGPGQVDFALLFRLSAIVAGCAAFGAFCQYIQTLLYNRITIRLIRSLRDRGMEKIQKLPVSWLDTHPPGEVISILVSDAEQLSDGILMGFTQFFSGALTILGTLIFMFGSDVRLSFLVLFITPLSLFAAGMIAKRTHEMFRLQAEARAKETALVEEFVGNEKLVKILNYEKRALERFRSLNEELRSSSLKAIFASSLTNPGTRFVNNIMYAAVACVGAFRVLSEGGTGFTVGALTCFLSYAIQYTRPFNEISGVFAELQGAGACAERIQRFLAEPEVDITSDQPGAKKVNITQESSAAEPVDITSIQPDAKQVDISQNNLMPSKVDITQRIPPALALRGISFSYDPARPFIRDLSFVASPGKHIAIVGPTGCGKTTLMNLLLRFYPVNAGTIEVEGRDINGLTAHDLRSRFGMVLQETWIRRATVRENIALGNENASEQEIVAAAKASGAHEFIKFLPKGYDTMLGDGYTVLSEGQRQLLSIARLFLLSPKIILLDEATSSIDTMTEKRIGEALEKLMEGRCALIVAHRLSTIRGADEILVMKDGAIIERGKHEELLSEGGFYAELVKSQYAGVAI